MRPITLLVLAGLGSFSALTVAIAPAEASAQSQNASARKARLIANVYLRSAPATTGKRLALVPRGEEVVVSSSQKGWTKVSARNQVGWIPSSAISLSKSEEVLSTESVLPVATPTPPRVAHQERATDAAPTPASVPSPAPPSMKDHDVPAARASSSEVTIGARTWLVGDGTTTFGAYGEKLVGPAIKDLANGRIGISAAADYVSTSNGPAKGTGFALMGMANYHPVFPTIPRLDPFIGLGLAYGHESVSVPVYQGINLSGGYNTGLVFVGHVGTRYFFTDKLGVQGDIGFGRIWSGEVSLGVAWRP